MFQSFFNGLSGMFNFAKSLDNVSNNVANMNTPGFRGTDNFFRSVNGSGDQGFGTVLDGTSTRLTNGEIRQTGNDTDVALTGRGFFVLRNDAGETFYTRAGQFRFNEDNVLVDTTTDMEVLGISASSTLQNIDITDFRIRPPVATSEVTFVGNLNSTAADHQIPDVTVYDATGEAHTLTLDFTNPTDTDDAWTITVSDDEGNSLGTGEIRFGSTSTLVENFNSFDLDLTFNGDAQTVTFNFGEPGSFNATTQFSGGDSTLGVDEINGNPVLGITSIEFNNEGVLQFTYSDGEVEEGAQLAVASFANESLLQLDSGALYRSSPGIDAEYGRAGEEGLGEVQGGSIELSNVDLTQEFADILIIQRGYQASSRIMSVSNELIEQLYNNTRG